MGLYVSAAFHRCHSFESQCVCVCAREFVCGMCCCIYFVLCAKRGLICLCWAWDFQYFHFSFCPPFISCCLYSIALLHFFFRFTLCVFYRYRQRDTNSWPIGIDKSTPYDWITHCKILIIVEIIYYICRCRTLMTRLNAITLNGKNHKFMFALRDSYPYRRSLLQTYYVQLLLQTNNSYLYVWCNQIDCRRNIQLRCVNKYMNCLNITESITKSIQCHKCEQKWHKCEPQIYFAFVRLAHAFLLWLLLHL